MTKQNFLTAVFLCVLQGCSKSPAKCVLTPVSSLPQEDVTVLTLAGNGAFGASDGAGGPNGPAEVCRPNAIAVDHHSNAYVVGHGMLVRKIDSNGNVTTTYPGRDDPSGPCGDPLKFSSSDPETAAVDDDGNVFVSLFDGTTQEITASGQLRYLTFSRTSSLPSGPFGVPSGLAVDGHGGLIITSPEKHQVFRLDLAVVDPQVPDRGLTVLAGSGDSGSADGMWGEAQFVSPEAAAVDASGNIFVIDRSPDLDLIRVRKIDASGAVTTLVGDQVHWTCANLGATKATGFNWYGAIGFGVAFDGDVFIGFLSGIARLDATGNVSWVAGGSSSHTGFVDGAGDVARFNGVVSIAAAPDGRLYVADKANNSIRVITQR